MNELIRAIMSREGCTEAEATNLWEEICMVVAEGIEDGEDPEEILHDYGFEPDYIFDVLPIGF